jgi:hypothetical protein
MNHCDSCKHFERDGAFDVPCPPDLNLPGPCHSFAPHCTYDPKWIKVSRPEEHYCAHWQEV